MSDIDELVAWSRAQIDKDERIATAAKGDTSGRWQRGEYFTVETAEPDRWDIIVYSEGSPTDDQADHITRQNPAHTLAVVAAHRKILELHRPDSGGWDGTDKRCQECGGYDLVAGLGARGYRLPWPCPTVRAVMAAYANRDECRPEWGQQP